MKEGFDELAWVLLKDGWLSNAETWMVVSKQHIAGRLDESSRVYLTEGVVCQGLLKLEFFVGSVAATAVGLLDFVLSRLERSHKSEVVVFRSFPAVIARSWNAQKIITMGFLDCKRADSTVLCGHFVGRNHQ